MDCYHLSLPLFHKKLGAIYRTTTPEFTCPPTCPFKGDGCFGDNFPCKMHWDAVSEGKRGVSFDEFCDKIAELPAGTKIRGCMVGDQPGVGEEIDPKMFIEMVTAYHGKRGWTYTHKPVLGDSATATTNRMLIEWSNLCGFTVNLSANNLTHADELAALGIGPVAVVVPEGTKKNHKTPGGRKVVMCPANGRGITCETCMLCARPDRRVVVGLEAHGSGKKKASKIAA